MAMGGAIGPWGWSSFLQPPMEGVAHRVGMQPPTEGGGGPCVKYCRVEVKGLISQSSQGARNSKENDPFTCRFRPEGTGRPFARSNWSTCAPPPAPLSW